MSLGSDDGHALAGANSERDLAASENSVINISNQELCLLTRSGDDGHAKAGAKTGGDLSIVRTQ